MTCPTVVEAESLGSSIVLPCHFATSSYVRASSPPLLQAASIAPLLLFPRGSQALITLVGRRRSASGLLLRVHRHIKLKVKRPLFQNTSSAGNKQIKPSQTSNGCGATPTQRGSSTGSAAACSFYGALLLVVIKHSRAAGTERGDGAVRRVGAYANPRRQ